jgi:hypothetical protein
VSCQFKCTTTIICNQTDILDDQATQEKLHL